MFMIVEVLIKYHPQIFIVVNELYFLAELLHGLHGLQLLHGLSCRRVKPTCARQAQGLSSAV